MRQACASGDTRSSENASAISESLRLHELPMSYRQNSLRGLYMGIYIYMFQEKCDY